MNIAMVVSVQKGSGNWTERLLPLLFYAVNAVVVVVAALWDPDPAFRALDHFHAALAMSAWLGFGTLVVGSFYSRNGIALVREARALQIPSIERAVLYSMLALFAATVVVPATILGWYAGGHLAFFLGELACVAFASFLLILPRAVGFAIYLLPSIAGSALDRHILDQMFSTAQFEASHFNAAAPFVAVLLGFLCAARWSQLQRVERGTTGWSRLLRANKDLHAALPSGTGTTVAPVLPERFRTRDRLSGVGPNRPVSAMRACWRSWSVPNVRDLWLLTKYIAFIFIMLVTALYFRDPTSTIGSAIDNAWKLLLLAFGFIGAFTALIFPDILRSRFQGCSSILTELALLPAWGGASQARRTMLLAIFGPQLGYFAISCILFVLGAYAKGAQKAVFALAVGVAVGVGSTTIALGMRALANLQKQKNVVLPMLFALVVSGFMLLPLTQHEHLRVDLMLRLDVLWLAVALAMGLVTLHAYHRFAARPHPFLAN